MKGKKEEEKENNFGLQYMLGPQEELPFCNNNITSYILCGIRYAYSNIS